MEKWHIKVLSKIGSAVVCDRQMDGHSVCAFAYDRDALTENEEKCVEQLESHSCYSSFLKALVCHANKLKPKQYTDNLIIVSTLKIWQQIKRHSSSRYTSSFAESSEWETELGIIMSDDWWTKALEEIKSCSSCAKFQLIQFKIVHRVHYSKSRLAKIYSNMADTCDVPRLLVISLMCFGHVRDWGNNGSLISEWSQ